jgi:hypothetical protein
MPAQFCAFVGASDRRNSAPLGMRCTIARAMQPRRGEVSPRGVDDGKTPIKPAFMHSVDATVEPSDAE